MFDTHLEDQLIINFATINILLEIIEYKLLQLIQSIDSKETTGPEVIQHVHAQPN